MSRTFLPSDDCQDTLMIDKGITCLEYAHVGWNCELLEADNNNNNNNNDHNNNKYFLLFFFFLFIE